ncbi:helix-turn-helix transcriptional regulator [Pendulispora rubella]|uniref:Helix-turn-helix transcriptional regulator n=1 Tax=Pendulispora rubella TaxID=2741070 RepID=A0ABZ2LI62_9BACT
MSVTNKRVRTKQPLENSCPAADAIALVGAKWTVLIIGALGKEGKLRYKELQRVVVGISQRMLTLTLKTLEENGLVKRTLTPAVPPRTDYELTPLGRSLFDPLEALVDWTLENRGAMEEARRAYVKVATKSLVEEKVP